MTHDPVDIFKSFHSYNSGLYNIPNQHAGLDSEIFRQKLRQYIQETFIPNTNIVEDRN